METTTHTRTGLREMLRSDHFSHHRYLVVVSRMETTTHTRTGLREMLMSDHFSHQRYLVVSASGPCLDEEEPTASEPWWRALYALLGRLWVALELLGLRCPHSGFLVQYVDEGNPQEVGEFHDRGKASKASWYGEVAIPGMVPNNLRSEPHFSHGS
ncbi:hypothetical protein Taro_048905, partial [Colocasia esculenta]|nr:hypothetical protein [Colocasia esculenta]